MRTLTPNHLAILGLAHIVEDERRLGAFLALSGATVEQLRDGIETLEVQAAVLDFLLADDDRLIAFCEPADIDPRQVLDGRRKLPGAPDA